MSKELAELHRESDKALSKAVFTGDAATDAEILLTGMIQARGEQVFEFVEAEQNSKHLSARGLVELHDGLIDSAIADGNTREALAVVLSFQRCKFNTDQILKSIERLYVVAKRTGNEPLSGAVNTVRRHSDLREIAEAITEEDFARVTGKVENGTQ